MCGIVGFYSVKKRSIDIKLLKRLMVESSIRGLHSFGVAYTVDGELVVRKSFRLHLGKLLFNYLRDGDKRLIFHSRYSTSGDFKDMNNNQPVVCEDVAIVLNGVISMDRKEVFEKEFGVKCKSDNDTEIILRRKGSYIKFLKMYPQASFAGIILKDGKMIAIRNHTRPMYMYESRRSKFLFSTIDIGVRAGIDVSDIKSVPSMEEVVI